MRALVLSGGGCRGCFQAGVLRHLVDSEDVDYDIYAGVSVGALNAAMLATGPLKESLPLLEDIWLKQIKGDSSVWEHHLWKYILAGIIFVLSFTVFAFLSFIFTAPKWITIVLAIIAILGLYTPYYTLNNTHSVYTTEPLRKLITKSLDLDKLQNSGKLLRLGAVNFNTGKYGCGTEKSENVIDWIMASSSFPIFFPMIEMDGEYWADGGVTEIAPLSDAIELGATEIDVILASPIETSYYQGLPGLPGQLMRDLDVMTSEIIKNDLHARCNISEDIKIRVFAPVESLTEHSLSFEPKRIKRMYEIGKKNAATQKDNNTLESKKHLLSH